jgi:hypothetical protein
MPNTLLPTNLAEVINFYAATVKGVANTLEKTETDELTKRMKFYGEAEMEAQAETTGEAKRLAVTRARAALLNVFDYLHPVTEETATGRTAVESAAGQPLDP